MDIKKRHDAVIGSAERSERVKKFETVTSQMKAGDKIVVRTEGEWKVVVLESDHRGSGKKQNASIFSEGNKTELFFNGSWHDVNVAPKKVLADGAKVNVGTIEYTATNQRVDNSGRVYYDLSPVTTSVPGVKEIKGVTEEQIEQLSGVTKIEKNIESNIVKLKKEIAKIAGAERNDFMRQLMALKQKVVDAQKLFSTTTDFLQFNDRIKALNGEVERATQELESKIAETKTKESGLARNAGDITLAKVLDKEVAAEIAIAKKKAEKKHEKQKSAFVRKEDELKEAVRDEEDNIVLLEKRLVGIKNNIADLTKDLKQKRDELTDNLNNKNKARKASAGPDIISRLDTIIADINTDISALNKDLDGAKKEKEAIGKKIETANANLLLNKRALEKHQQNKPAESAAASPEDLESRILVAKLEKIRKKIESARTPAEQRILDQIERETKSLTGSTPDITKAEEIKIFKQWIADTKERTEKVEKIDLEKEAGEIVKKFYELDAKARATNDVNLISTVDNISTYGLAYVLLNTLKQRPLHPSITDQKVLEMWETLGGLELGIYKKEQKVTLDAAKQNIDAEKSRAVFKDIPPNIISQLFNKDTLSKASRTALEAVLKPGTLEVGPVKQQVKEMIENMNTPSAALQAELLKLGIPDWSVLKSSLLANQVDVIAEAMVARAQAEVKNMLSMKMADIKDVEGFVNRLKEGLSEMGMQIGETFKNKKFLLKFGINLATVVGGALAGSFIGGKAFDAIAGGSGGSPDELLEKAQNRLLAKATTGGAFGGLARAITSRIFAKTGWLGKSGEEIADKVNVRKKDAIKTRLEARYGDDGIGNLETASILSVAVRKAAETKEGAVVKVGEHELKGSAAEMYIRGLEIAVLDQGLEVSEATRLDFAQALLKVTGKGRDLTEALPQDIKVLNAVISRLFSTVEKQKGAATGTDTGTFLNKLSRKASEHLTVSALVGGGVGAALMVPGPIGMLARGGLGFVGGLGIGVKQGYEAVNSEVKNRAQKNVDALIIRVRENITNNNGVDNLRLCRELFTALVRGGELSDESRNIMEGDKTDKPMYEIVRALRDVSMYVQSNDTLRSMLESSLFEIQRSGIIEKQDFKDSLANLKAGGDKLEEDAKNNGWYNVGKVSKRWARGAATGVVMGAVAIGIGAAANLARHVIWGPPVSGAGDSANIDAVAHGGTEQVSFGSSGGEEIPNATPGSDPTYTEGEWGATDGNGTTILDEPDFKPGYENAVSGTESSVSSGQAVSGAEGLAGDHTIDYEFGKGDSMWKAFNDFKPDVKLPDGQNFAEWRQGELEKMGFVFKGDQIGHPFVEKPGWSAEMYTGDDGSSHVRVLDAKDNIIADSGTEEYPTGKPLVFEKAGEGFPVASVEDINAKNIDQLSQDVQVQDISIGDKKILEVASVDVGKPGNVFLRMEDGTLQRAHFDFDDTGKWTSVRPLGEVESLDTFLQTTGSKSVTEAVNKLYDVPANTEYDAWPKSERGPFEADIENRLNAIAGNDGLSEEQKILEIDRLRRHSDLIHRSNAKWYAEKAVTSPVETVLADKLPEVSSDQTLEDLTKLSNRIESLADVSGSNYDQISKRFYDDVLTEYAKENYQPMYDMAREMGVSVGETPEVTVAAKTASGVGTASSVEIPEPTEKMGPIVAPREVEAKIPLRDTMFDRLARDAADRGELGAGGEMTPKSNVETDAGLGAVKTGESGDFEGIDFKDPIKGVKIKITGYDVNGNAEYQMSGEKAALLDFEPKGVVNPEELKSMLSRSFVKSLKENALMEEIRQAQALKLALRNIDNLDPTYSDVKDLTVRVLNSLKANYPEGLIKPSFFKLK